MNPSLKSPGRSAAGVSTLAPAAVSSLILASRFRNDRPKWSMTVLGPGLSPFEKMTRVRPNDTRCGLCVGVAPRYLTYHSPAFAGSGTRMCRSSNAMVLTAGSAAEAASAPTRTKQTASNGLNFIVPPREKHAMISASRASARLYITQPSRWRECTCEGSETPGHGSCLTLHGGTDAVLLAGISRPGTDCGSPGGFK